MPRLGAVKATAAPPYDPTAWRGKLLVREGGREAKGWLKLSRPQGRPTDPHPLRHPDFPYSHQRERVCCFSVGLAFSAVVTKQARSAQIHPSPQSFSRFLWHR